MTPSIAFGSPPSSIGMDGEPETIKRVCCEAAIIPRTFMTLIIAFGGAEPSSKEPLGFGVKKLYR